MKKTTLLALLLTLGAALFTTDFVNAAVASGAAKSPTAICDRAQDSLALVQIYHALNGSNWSNSWNLSQPMNQWLGVTLSPEGCVESLNITDKLRGTVPDISLPNLKALHLVASWLRDSTFITSVPDFSGLPSLELLRIVQLVTAPANTSIPDFSHLPLLKTLEFRLNVYSGVLTNFSHLPELESLTLAHNFTSGNLLDYTLLPQLEKLHIVESVTGEIPDFQHLSSLKELYLGGSKSLGLVSLALLTGEIPDFSNLPNLEQLTLTYLGQNSAIPNFSQLPKLTNLLISGSSLQGGIPDFDQMSLLQTLRIGGYYSWFFLFPEQPYPTPISGSIPNFSGMPELEILDLSLNRLKGTIPDFSHFSKIRTIDLGGNQLSGTIPPFLNLPNTAQNINLTANELDSCAFLLTTALTAVTQNILTFESILPNLLKFSAYKPQDSIPVSPLYFSNGSGNKEIDILLDENVVGSTYKWYKNSVLIGTTAINNLELASEALISDVFYVVITNPQAASLTLITKKFRLSNVLPEAAFTFALFPACNQVLLNITNTSTNAFSWLWTFPSATPASSSDKNPSLIKFMQSGAYLITLIATNNLGSDTFSQLVTLSVHAVPSADFSVVQNGNTVTCTATEPNVNFYSWNFGDFTFSSMGPSVMHTYSVNGTYTIGLTISNNCGIANSTQSVGISPTVSPISAAKISVYPNPASERLTLEMESNAAMIGTSNLSCCLRNALGQSVLAEDVAWQGDRIQHHFEVGHLVAGVYFLEVFDGSQWGQIRVLIVP